MDGVWEKHKPASNDQSPIDDGEEEAVLNFAEEVQRFRGRIANTEEKPSAWSQYEQDNYQS
jgi:hypothetical protein